MILGLCDDTWFCLCSLSVLFFGFCLVSRLQENVVAECCLVEIFLWTCAPVLLSWCIPQEHLLVLEAGMMQCIIVSKVVGDALCDPLEMESERKWRPP